MRALLALVVLAGAACSPTSIAGFEIGERRCDSGYPDFGPGSTNACSGYKTLGQRYIDEDEPAHAPVIATEVYVDPIHVAHSGAATSVIVVIRLTGDAVRAYRIGCGIGLDSSICVDRDGHAQPASS